MVCGGRGRSVCFNVYVYNVQPGITIDYATGESWQEGAEPQSGETTYILNTNSHKFHDPDCSSVSGMSTANRQEYTGSREDLIAQGYLTPAVLNYVALLGWAPRASFLRRKCSLWRSWWPPLIWRVYPSPRPSLTR